MTAIERLQSWKRDVDATLDELLPVDDGPAGTVAQAMRYAVLGGGKRLRPQLALAACEACGADPHRIYAAAAAIELLHTYSLVHDDLPAMDDDDLRRGRPTVHRQFSEAVAVLAGDALHTLAFELLAEYPSGDASAAHRLAAVSALARAAGLAGMVGGQVADLEAEGGAPVDAQRLGWIHRHKTGALFVASLEIGAIHADADHRQLEALRGFGRKLGLAFQVADDLLDRTATAEELGKTPGKDERTAKSTYPALYGMDGARNRAVELLDGAQSELTTEGLATEPLQALIHAVRARCS